MTAAPSASVAGSPVGGVADGAASPPFSLPGSHFAVALVFFVAGSAGLVFVAPALAGGGFLAPRVVAVTHLFTLGWITTSIMGALYQFLPVALGESIRWPGLARATLAIYAPGLALFVGALVFYRPDLIVIGASAFGMGILLFIMNLVATLHRARTRDVTWWALAWASAFLALTAVVGGALAGNLRWGYMGGERLVALTTHLHIALVGWVLLVVVGVAHRLLPMFLLSHGADDRFGKASVALLASGVLALFLMHHLATPWRRWLPGGLILLGVAAFLAQARSFYRHRRRRDLDPGMRAAARALVVLGAAAVLGAYLAAAGFATSVPLATAYVLLLVLGFALFVAAHYYKIVPFLVWYHRFGPLAGLRPVPRVADLYSARWAEGAGLLLLAGVAALAVSVGVGAGPVARAAAVLFATGAVVEAVQMLSVSRRRPA